MEFKIDQQNEDLKQMWYRSTAVIFEVVKTMNRREVVFLATNRKLTHRCLKINAVRFFYKSATRFHFFDPEYLYNVYNSVGHFPSMPMFSFNWDTKKLEQKDFNENFRDYLEGYDFVIDLDNPNLEKVHSSAKRLKKIFDEYQIRYHVKFSGTKGFHFVVEWIDLPGRFLSVKPDDLVHLFKVFAKEMKYSMKITDLDETIYDLRRILKTPYTVVYPTYYVALPLTDEQFDNFNYEMVSLRNLLSNANAIKMRGLLTRNRTKDKSNLLNLMRSVANKSRKRSWLFNEILRIKKEYLSQTMKKILGE